MHLMAVTFEFSVSRVCENKQAELNCTYKPFPCVCVQVSGEQLGGNKPLRGCL